MIRNGKIARLPRDIRDQLNRRLADAEPGDTLLPWLNSLPEVQAVLARQFGGVPVSKQNLSEWRAGGFAEWQTRQDTLADARELAADAAELEAVTDGRLTDHLATVLAARYASAVSGWDGQPTEEFRQKLKVLRGMCQDIVELRRGDHSGARLQMDRQRLEEKRERTEDEVVAQFEEWAKSPAVKDWICQDWIPPKERRRRMREIFGRPPEPDDEDPETPEPDPVKPGQTTVAGEAASESSPDRAGEGGHPPEMPDFDSRAESGSNPVKPSQTNFEMAPAPSAHFPEESVPVSGPSP